MRRYYLAQRTIRGQLRGSNVRPIAASLPLSILKYLSLGNVPIALPLNGNALILFALHDVMLGSLTGWGLNKMFHTFSDSAMGSSLGIADPLNGGIDIKNIGVTRKDDVARITFDEAAVRQVLEGGFNGFTPVIIGIEPLPSPVVVLR